MAIKKINSKEKIAAAGDVTPEQLKALVKNYYQKMAKKNKGGGNHEPLDKKKDSRAVWFHKQKLDELFEANGYSNTLPDDEKKKFGLRLYFGVHDMDTILTNIPDVYDNQQMVILYVTKQDGVANNDLNQDGDAVEIAGTDVGLGLDHGKLCPPDTGCEDVTMALNESKENQAKKD